MSARQRLRGGAAAAWGALVLAASIVPLAVLGVPWTVDSYGKFRASMDNRAQIRRAEAAHAARTAARRERTILRQVRQGQVVVVATGLGRMPGAPAPRPVGPVAPAPAADGPAVALLPFISPTQHGG